MSANRQGGLHSTGNAGKCCWAGFAVAGTEFVTGEVRIIRVSTIIATESLGTKAMIADGGGYKKAVNRSIWDTFPSKFFRAALVCELSVRRVSPPS